MNLVKQFEIALKEYYIDSTNEGFRNMELIGYFDHSEIESFNKSRRLEDIAGSKMEDLMTDLLKDASKINFVIYLLATKQLVLELNKEDNSGATVFMRIAEIYFNKESYYLGQAIGNLLSRGYSIREADIKFVNGLYSNTLKEEQFLNWVRLRFAVLTMDGTNFFYALKKQKVLFALLSFKIGRPIYYKLPNLLGVAGNALHNYSENGKIILHAIEIYGRKKEIDALDLKKGNLAEKIATFQNLGREQDSKFLFVASLIFPELSN